MIDRIKSHPEVLMMAGVMILMSPYAVSLLRNRFPPRWTVLLFWLAALIFFGAPLLTVVYLTVQLYRG